MLGFWFAPAPFRSKKCETIPLPWCCRLLEFLNFSKAIGLDPLIVKFGLGLAAQSTRQEHVQAFGSLWFGRIPSSSVEEELPERFLQLIWIFQIWMEIELKRRTLLKSAPAALISAHGKLWAMRSFQTEWRIGAQQGLEACLLMGVMSAPSLQAESYPADRDYWLQRVSPEALRALASLRAAIDAQHGLLGPQLALLASAAPSETLAATIAAFENPELIRAGLRPTEFWGGDKDWQASAALCPDAAIVLKSLSLSGFVDYWQDNKKPAIDGKINVLASDLAKIDLIGMQQRYVRRRLNPRIDVYLSAYSEPHGIRIVGQRFLTSFAYPSIFVKRNAAHEIFHPFLLPNRAETARIVAGLSSDPLLRRIDSRADKSDGYSTISSLIEEGIVQALEATVSSQLGFGSADLGAYWREQDGGIHLLAAAAYHAMQESGFTRHGGDALAWFWRAVRSKELAGDGLVRHARAIVGTQGILRWLS